MKKLLLSLVLIFSMLFSFTAVGFAAVPEDEVAQPYVTSSMNISVSRDSGTEGSATIDVNFAGTMDTYKVTVYLQKLSNGSWVNDTSNEDYIKIVNGTDRSWTFFDSLYDDLTRGVSYRVKVVSKTTHSGTTYTASGYSATF